MGNSQRKVLIHPQFIERLFTHKRRVSDVFNDVLGIHQINHMAITRIDKSQQLLTFSSTPALEFNLFTSKLWCFDKTYDPNWFRLCTHANWQSLYHPARYDELYYTKQLKHDFSNTLSLVTTQHTNYYIYSMASSGSHPVAQELFIHHYPDFYKMGEYCVNLLSSFFID